MADLMPPPPRPIASKRASQVANNLDETLRLDTQQSPQSDAESESRSSIDAPSTAITSPMSSRASNRLSLTLPIMPATSAPSRTRATPTSAVPLSQPPTPAAETRSTFESSSDPNDIILAIAAQERKVLELREDLKTAEADLAKLKKQWGKFDTVRRRNALVKPDRPLERSFDSPEEAGKGEPISRSASQNKSRPLILGQQQAQAQAQGVPSTPQFSGRRKVIRSSHARTLSLLSPTKTDQDFAVMQDGVMSPKQSSESQMSPTQTRHTLTAAAQLAAKRTSWQPRSTNTAVPGLGVKQLAEDIKAGLWTFVDDLRQATVGDEPVTGSNGTPQRQPQHRRMKTVATGYFEDANMSTNSPSRTPSSIMPTPAPKLGDPLKESENAANARRGPRPTSMIAAKPSKRFSMTPLAADGFDDADWSSWDSPPTTTSARWSGSTMGGVDVEGGLDNAEESDENNPASPMSPSAMRLEELSLNVLHKLHPNNIKRATSDFLKEWEKSLAEPDALGPAAESPARAATTAPVAEAQ